MLLPLLFVGLVLAKKATAFDFDMTFDGIQLESSNTSSTAAPDLPLYDNPAYLEDDDFVANYTPTIHPLEWNASNTPDASGTNFHLGVPFNFTNIIIMAGRCGEGGWYQNPIEEDWYSKWAAAGEATIEQAQVVCVTWQDSNVSARQAHLDAFEKVEELAGDKLNETLVITVGQGMEVDWSPVANLLRKGMAFFHAKEDPINFNLTEHNLSPEDILYFYFQWEEHSVARRIGQELCRVKAGSQYLKVAKIKIDVCDGCLDYRIEESLKGFREACPEIKVIEVWEMKRTYEEKQETAFETKLLINVVPDVILTGGDFMANDILDIAKRVLPDADYSQLGTTGWDHNFPHLLKNHKLLATVNQDVHFANSGLWKAINAVVKNVQKSGLNSTKALQNELELGDTLTIQSETVLISSDQVGYLRNTLLQAYDSGSPPFGEVEVSTGMYDVTISKVIPFEGKFQAVLWLFMTWKDPRLEWHPMFHDHEIPIDPTSIWTPQLYFSNQFLINELHEGQALVHPNGTVMFEKNYVAEFLCATTEDLRSFPFDNYDCSIDLVGPKGVHLNATYGFDVIESDPHFATSTSIAEEEDEGHSHRSNIIFFQLQFARRPFSAYVRLIVPAILINMIGFMTFWIREPAPTIVLGITSLLCSLALRDTWETPDTADVTWTEVFLLVNVSYQVSVMVVIWLSYGGSKKVKAAVDRLFQHIHPQNVAKQTGKVAKEGWKDASMVATKTGEVAREAAKAGWDEASSAAKKLRTRTGEVARNVTQSVTSSVTHPERKVPKHVVRPTNELASFRRRRRHMMPDMSSSSNDIVNKQRGSKVESPREARPGVEHAQDMNHSAKDDEGGASRPSSENSNQLADWMEYTEPIRDASADDCCNKSHMSELSHSVIGDHEHEIASDYGGDEHDDDSSSHHYSNIELNNSPGPVNSAPEEDAAPEQERQLRRLVRMQSQKLLRRNSIIGEIPFDVEDWPDDVDWIGRWLVVPSYIIVMLTLVFHGWGFFD